MKKRMVLGNRYISIMLAALVGGMAIPAFCSDDVPKEIKSSLMHRAKQTARTLIAKGKEVAKNKKVREYAAVGLLITVIAVSAYCLGKYGKCPFGDSSAMVGNSKCPIIAKSKDERCIQVRVANQKGLTCGHHAVKNGSLIKGGLNQALSNLAREIQTLNHPIFKSIYEATQANRVVSQAEIGLDAKDENEIQLNPANEDLEVNEVVLAITEVLHEDPLNFVVYDGAHNFTSDVVVFHDGLRDKIEAFKRNDDSQALSVVLSLGGHWIVDVIYKKKTDTGIMYQHIIADSCNGNQLNNPVVKNVMAIESDITI